MSTWLSQLLTRGELPRFFGQNVPVESQSVPCQQGVALLHHLGQVTDKIGHLFGAHAAGTFVVRIPGVPRRWAFDATRLGGDARDSQGPMAHSNSGTALGENGRRFDIESQIIAIH